MVNALINNETINKILLLIFAITLQVQITLFASEAYLGLRLSSADLFLPLAACFLFFCYLRNGPTIRTQQPFHPFFLIGPSIAIIFALINGYLLSGQISSWALINKTIGWFVLVTYFCAGMYIICTSRICLLKSFVLPACLFTAASLFFECILRLYFKGNLAGVMGYGFDMDLSGFMNNRNAFTFLYLSVFIISSQFLLHAKKLPKSYFYIFNLIVFLSPLFLTTNLSRSGFIVLSLYLLFLLIFYFKPFAKKIIPVVLIGICLVPLSNPKRISDVWQTAEKFKTSASLIFEDGSLISQNVHDSLYMGDQLRIDTITSALSVYLQSPYTGAGLGSILEKQKSNGNDRVSVMDNTILWILTEMGPLGLWAFILVYITMLAALKRKSNGMTTDHEIFAHAMIFVLLAFGIFSMFHEILYSRFLWFFLGLALAIPVTTQHQQKLEA